MPGVFQPEHSSSSVNAATLDLLLGYVGRAMLHTAVRTDSRVLLAREDVVDMTTELNIIVCKLAQLGIIEANVLLLSRGAQRQTRDKVHQEEDDTSHDKGVRESGDTVGKLVTELDVIVVQPASGDNGSAVEMGNVITGTLSA